MNNDSQKLKFFGIVGVVVVIVVGVLFLLAFNRDDVAQSTSADQDQLSQADQNTQDQTQASSDLGGANSPDTSGDAQDTDVNASDSNGQEDTQMIADIESAANDISELQDALSLYVANNNGNLPKASQAISGIKEIADELVLEYYSLDNIFYLSIDFDSSDASEELAEAAHTIVLDKILVWAGYECATDLVATGDDPSSTVVASNSRALSIVFMQAGSSTLGCVNV